MPLLLLSLDNTLIDREGAFRAWGQDFLEQVGAPDYDLDWLLSVDADGMTPSWDLADAIQDRYGLRIPAIDLVNIVREGLLDRMRLEPLVACALGIAEDAGGVPVVVTNGETRLQEEKLRRTGLDRYLAAWVISEEAGARKPNPRIFGIAAERARVRLSGAWVIGDAPEADIGGAEAIGAPSIWLRRGRTWQEPQFTPTRTVNTVIEALAVVLGA
ncbi:MAG: haloacid dehalogenase, partial [Dactylosporangium sp.]|nr:haloacid dehalogenase [Dactylosporangium sp.]